MKAINMVVVLFFCCLVSSAQLFGMEAGSANQKEKKIEQKNGKITFKMVQLLLSQKKADTLRRYEQMEREKAILSKNNL
ncbi:MAG TPA: hypothetical protein VHO47_00375 [Candidatus Babeliales bacterium]|nr:hypothetical protein [Candidatus Babeliales bacterium]